MRHAQRLETLERDVLRLKRHNRALLVAAAIVAGIGAVWGAIRATEQTAFARDAMDPKTVRASAFILEDQDGKPRATLELVDGEPALKLLDKDARPRAVLALLEKGPALALMYENGKPCASLRGTLSSPALQLWDQAGKSRAKLELLEGHAGLWLSGEHVQERASLTAGSQRSILSIGDREGMGVLAVASNDGPTLGLTGADGQPRVTLSLSEGAPTLMMTEKDAKPRMWLGNSSLQFFDLDGSVAWSTAR